MDVIVFGSGMKQCRSYMDVIVFGSGMKQHRSYMDVIVFGSGMKQHRSYMDVIVFVFKEVHMLGGHRWLTTSIASGMK
jgi:uncharacterized protein YegL